MTSATPLHPASNRQPFLPQNFYEAPQYASFRPTAATVLAAPFPVITDSELTSTDGAIAPRTYQDRPVARKAEWERQVRAQEIHGWLDNLHLQFENYMVGHSHSPTLVRAYEDGTSTPNIVRAIAAIEKKTRGRPKKIIANRLKPYLKYFIFPKDALQALPMFDDIVTGAVKLDAGGNTRPLSKTMMVGLLQVLDEVSAEAVQEDIRCSLRHAQRVAQCLRIIEQVGSKIAQKDWHTPSETDWSDLDLN